MFSIVLEIYNSGLINDWKVFGFRSCKHLWSDILVGYIIVLPLVSKGFSPNLCLRLLIDDKDSVSQNFKKDRKVECCQ